MGFAALSPSYTGGYSRAELRLPGQQDAAQLLGHAQHRVMAGVELVPFSAKLIGGAALMRLPRVLRPPAPDHIGFPFLRPERVELDPLGIDAGRVLRVAVERPGARRGIEIGEEAALGVLAGRAAGQPAAV